MKLKATLLVVFYILSMAKWQGQAQDQQAPTDMVAPAIAGVVAGGTKVQLVKDGFKNTDGVVAMPDGSALFWDNDPVSVIYKVDNSGNASPFLEHMRGTQGLGQHRVGQCAQHLLGARGGRSRLGGDHPHRRREPANGLWSMHLQPSL